MEPQNTVVSINSYKYLLVYHIHFRSTSLTPSLFIEVPVPGKWPVMCMCLRDIWFSYFYDFLLNFLIVCYFFVFHFIIGCGKKYDDVTLTSPNSWDKITIIKKRWLRSVFRNLNRQNEIPPNWYQLIIRLKIHSSLVSLRFCCNIISSQHDAM